MWIITPFALHLRKIHIHLCPNLFHYGQYTLINTSMTFICAQGTFKNNICICVNIQNHQKTNNTILRHSLTENVFSFSSKWTSLSRNDNHLHFWTILFQQKTFNNTICMRTHNQLHYYTIISMEVTIFIAVRQTLPCFHLTLRENNRSLAWFFRKEILSPNFHRKLDYKTRDHMHFLKHTFTSIPLQI